jgi:hypothetical protein
MPDFDVAAVGLDTPPAAASLTTYRPAISVRNNGIHPALATGYIRIYRAGSLVFTSNVYSGLIQPGQTKPAQADTYWTPGIVGTYQVSGYVTTIHDQVEHNNQLAPTLVTVTAAPPPPPPPVVAHASQHEDGGSDELNLDGLPGTLAEPQPPANHNMNHQAGGSDVLNVTDLPGQLAESQAVRQHGNEKHSAAFVTAAEVEPTIRAIAQPIAAEQVVAHDMDPNPHQAAEFVKPEDVRPIANEEAAHAISVHNVGQDQHDADTGLEHVRQKGKQGGYPEIDREGRIIDPMEPTSSALMSQLLGQEHGVAPLDDDRQLPKVHLAQHNVDPLAHPDLVPRGVELAAHKGQPDGYAPLDDESQVPRANIQFTAPLDGLGHVPDPNLPATVERTAHRGQPDGYASLDADGKVPAAQIAVDLSGVELVAHKAQPDGYASLDADGKVPAAQMAVDLSGVELLAHKAQPDGYASLDAGGKVPAAQMAVDLSGVELLAHKAQPDGYASLNPNGKVPGEQLDLNLAGVEQTNNKDQPDGYAGLDHFGHIDPNTISLNVEQVRNKDMPNGYAGLSNLARVPVTRLASSLDCRYNPYAPRSVAPGESADISAGTIPGTTISIAGGFYAQARGWLTAYNSDSYPNAHSIPLILASGNYPNEQVIARIDHAIGAGETHELMVVARVYGIPAGGRIAISGEVVVEHCPANTGRQETTTRTFHRFFRSGGPLCVEPLYDFRIRLSVSGVTNVETSIRHGNSILMTADTPYV